MKPNFPSFIYLALIILAISSSCKTTKNNSMNNMVARMEVTEPIEGICDNANVIAILPFPGNGQNKAIPSKTKEQLTAQLNVELAFLKDKPDYDDEGKVNLIINCNGELVRCQIDNKTKSNELDEQIVAVFSTLKQWTPGSINGNPVDTSVLYSFEIKDGKILLN